MDTVKTIAKWVAGGLLVTAGAAGLGLYYFQTNLIYPSNIPEGSRLVVPTPDEFGMNDYEEVDLVSPDGVKLKAFFIPSPLPERERKRTVLLLHANAGNVGHRLPIAKVFVQKMKANVVALSYRGYGKSEGVANEKGIRLDAQTALDYILSHPKLEKSDIYLYGQSIGGAVATDLAGRNGNRINGLIVENTFLSLPQLVPSVMPYLAPFVPYLLHQIWPSDQSIKLLPRDVPVLFLSGKGDELIPPAHMKALYELCPSEKKRWEEFEKGTHNDTCMQPGYFAAIAAFLAEHSPLSAAPALSSPTSEKEDPSSSSTSEKAMSEKSFSGESEYDMIGSREGLSMSIAPEDVVKEKARNLERRVEEKL